MDMFNVTGEKGAKFRKNQAPRDSDAKKPNGRAEWVAKENRKRLYFAVSLVAIFLTIGFVAYHYVEGWDWLTSLYFMSATMTTVGYGDVTPKTSLGKLMTVFFMWVGISIGFYMLYSISKFREMEIDSRVRKLIAGTRR
ncbi:MAG: potassium channel family protein [Candidatus ainarchaeum sp.]|nr:potassium channel family protein [Candidatus ainarchaeum sp.]